MVTPGYYPIKGGTETVVRNYSLALNKIGVHTDVMTFNMDRKWNPKWRGKIEKIDGINIFRIPAFNWLPIEHSPRITQGINLIPGKFTNIFNKYDIIHFHEVDLSFPLFSFFVRKPKILHLHGIDVNYYRRYYLSRLLLKHVADYYISISRQMKKDLIELGFHIERIEYLPNCVDVKIFSPEGEKDENLLLFVGRITFGKGLHILLDSLTHLTKSVRLIIVGPPSENHEYYQHILKRIEQENRKGKHEIIYLGALDQKDIIKWYQKASMFILPSFREGLPMVVLESLSCETPVVATPVGGIPEAIQNFETGILTPINNSLKLAEAIQYLLDNAEIRVRLGVMGRKEMIKHFSLEVTTKKLCKIYNKLIRQ